MSHSALGEQFSYRGYHRPDPEGARLHEAERAFPDVLEEGESLYGHGERDRDGESLSAIRASSGRPDAMVTVHRAVPHGVTSINPGDWVSLSREYARQHGMHDSDPSQDWPVLSMSVPARELSSEGNSIHEWGWFPES